MTLTCGVEIILSDATRLGIIIRRDGTFEVISDPLSNQYFGGVGWERRPRVIRLAGISRSRPGREKGGAVGRREKLPRAEGTADDETGSARHPCEEHTAVQSLAPASPCITTRPGSGLMLGRGIGSPGCFPYLVGRMFLGVARTSWVPGEG